MLAHIALVLVGAPVLFVAHWLLSLRRSCAEFDRATYRCTAALREYPQVSTDRDTSAEWQRRVAEQLRLELEVAQCPLLSQEFQEAEDRAAANFHECILGAPTGMGQAGEELLPWSKDAIAACRAWSSSGHELLRYLRGVVRFAGAPVLVTARALDALRDLSERATSLRMLRTA